MRAIVVVGVMLLAACDAEWMGYQVSVGPSADAAPHALAPPNLPVFFDCLRERGQTIIAAHRGGPAAGFAENAIPTFENTLRGAPAILEIDIAVTRDGVLVLMHDDTLERTTDGAGAVRDHSLAEIRALRLRDNDGNTLDAHPPTLREALNWAADHAIFELDVKQGVSYEDVVAAVRAADAANRVIFITYSVPAAIRVHRLAPELMISVNIASESELDELERAGVDLTRILAWTGTEEPNSALNAALNARGVEAIFGTLGNPEHSWDGRFAREGADQYAAFAETGLAVIATDRPVEAAHALDAKDGAEGVAAMQCAGAR